MSPCRLVMDGPGARCRLIRIAQVVPSRLRSTVALTALAGTESNRTSRTRNSHPAEAAVACRNRGSRKNKCKHRSAWSRPTHAGILGTSRDRSRCALCLVGVSSRRCLSWKFTEELMNFSRKDLAVEPRKVWTSLERAQLMH